MTSILTYTLKALGKKLDGPQRKLALTARVDGIPLTEPIRLGDILTVSVTCEKLSHAKKAESDSDNSQRVFMALVNYATDQMIVEEIAETEELLEKEFKIQLRERGKNSFRVYAFTGDGRIDSSFNRDVYAL